MLPWCESDEATDQCPMDVGSLRVARPITSSLRKRAESHSDPGAVHALATLWGGRVDAEGDVSPHTLCARMPRRRWIHKAFLQIASTKTSQAQDQAGSRFP